MSSLSSSRISGARIGTVGCSNDQELPSTERQIKSRLIPKGPGYVERERSGYKGYAWYDLPKSRGTRVRPRSASLNRVKFSSLSGGVEQKSHEAPPGWLKLEQLEVQAASVEQALSEVRHNEMEKAARVLEERLEREQQEEEHLRLQLQHELKEENEKQREKGNSTTSLKQMSLEQDIQREDRLRALIIGKGQARRRQLRLRERLEKKYGLETVLTLQDDKYHLPRSTHLNEAKTVSESVQSNAIRRNWIYIKIKFDSHGGVMKLDQLRKTLIGSGITPAHAGRVTLRAAGLLMPGDDLVSYQDFMGQYFAKEEEYITDSELEDSIESSDNEVREEKDSDPQANEEGILQTTIDDTLSEATSRWSTMDKRARKVARLKRNIKAAVKVKGVPIGVGNNGNLDDLVENAGYSFDYLKPVYKYFILPKPVRKSTAMMGSPRRQPMVSSRTVSHNVIPLLPSRPTPSSIAHLLQDSTTLTGALELIRHAAIVPIQSLVRKFSTITRLRNMHYERIIAQSKYKRDVEVAMAWFKSFQERYTINHYYRPRFLRWKGLYIIGRKKRERFRVCFWPFYVWRRHTFAMILAREKAKFLCQVWRTYQMIRHIRAWYKLLFKSRAQAASAEALRVRHWKSVQRTQLQQWRFLTRKRKLMNETWQNKGRNLQLKILRLGLMRSWCTWKLMAAGRVARRRRALTLYSYAPQWFCSTVRMVRKNMNLPPRMYTAIENQPELNFPSFETLLGSFGMEFLEQDSRTMASCRAVYSELVKSDRLTRIASCIERNRLGPVVFKRWREFVEEGQKDRYAWHHYVYRIQRYVFKDWKDLTKATRKAKKRKVKANAKSKTAAPVPPPRKTVYIAGKNKVNNNTSSPTTRRRRCVGMPVEVGQSEQALSPTDDLEKEEEEEEEDLQRVRAKKELEDRRVRMRAMQEERAKSHEKWVRDGKWHRRTIVQSQDKAKELRRARVKHSEKIRLHEQRLEEAKQNAKLSCLEMDGIISEKKDELTQRKKMQLQHAAKLQGMRGRMLHDVLVNVITEVEQTRLLELKQMCFRMMRFPITVRKSFGVMQKQRLKNWVRICTRLRKVWRAMPKFYTLKVKWQMFNKWLLFIDHKYQYESPQIRKQLRVRKQKLAVYSDFLKDEGVEYGFYKAESVRTVSWFKRWVEFSEKSWTRKRIVDIFRKRQDYLLKRRTLFVWRLSLKAKHTYELRQDREPFLAIRCRFDLDRLKRVMLQQEKKLLSRKLRRRNRFVRDKLQQSVHGPDAFERVLLKRILERHTQLTNARVELESRLLCTAFEERATFSFQDKDTKVVGLQDAEISGGRPFRDQSVASAVSVHSVLVAVSDGMVVALQMKMRSGTRETPLIWANPVRGLKASSSTSGGAVSGSGNDEDDVGEVQQLEQDPLSRTSSGAKPLNQCGLPSNVEVFEFELNEPREKIEAIEGYAMEHVVGGKVRFRTNLQRYSPWYGQGEGGKWFVLPKTREMNHLGTHRFVEEFIIGFHGFESDTSMLSLGAVVRQVDQTNVFSNSWLDRVESLMDTTNSDEHITAEEIESQAQFIAKQQMAHQREFNTVLLMRCGDIERAHKRSLRLAQHMRYGDHTPKSLRKVSIIDKVMRWFFNSQSNKLVKLNQFTKDMLGRSVDESGCVARGYMQIHKGNLQLKNVQKQISRLRGLIRRQGKSDLNEAHIGQKRHREIMEQLGVKKQEAKEAEELIIQGRTVVDKGLFNMPKLDTSQKSLDYYENLVRLAVIKDQLH